MLMCLNIDIYHSKEKEFNINSSSQKSSKGFYEKNYSIKSILYFSSVLGVPHFVEPDAPATISMVVFFLSLNMNNFGFIQFSYNLYYVK